MGTETLGFHISESVIPGLKLQEGQLNQASLLDLDRAAKARLN